jgi:hypothetical protein
MGLRSLFAVSPAATMIRDSGSRTSSVLGVSHALDVFYSASSVGLFHPTTTHRVHLQGFSLSRSRGCLVDIPCPLVVVTVPLPPVARRRHVAAPRPQGFAPRENP